MKQVLLEMSRFASVGVLATLVGVGGMFAAYNLLHLGYWASSALAFVGGAALSFVLNRRFTFRHGGSWKKALPRFALNVAICYGLAFGAAKPLVLAGLSALDLQTGQSLGENLALLLGNGLYTGLNYLGQKWFVFHKGKA